MPAEEVRGDTRGGYTTLSWHVGGSSVRADERRLQMGDRNMHLGHSSHIFNA